MSTTTSTMTGSKVGEIIKSLNSLEDDLDSLSEKAAGMKRQLAVKAQAEIDALLEKSREMALKEAETAIEASKKKATAQSKKITKDGEAKLAEIQSKIDSSFDDAVEYVVATVLKA